MLDFSHRETDKNEIEKSQKNLSSKSELDFENSSKENFILKKQEGNTLLFKTEIEQKNNFELSDIKKNNYIQKNFTFNIIKKNSINKNQ